MRDLSSQNAARNDNSIAVSVLMPCYNAAATLDEAVESILGQSLKELELVAVDDGSTDGTPDRLVGWARRDPRMRVLSQRHTGIIEALNAGLRICGAPLIARMDADDRSHRERLKAQVGYLEAHPGIAAVSCLVEAYPSEDVREGFRVYLEWLNGLQSQDEIAQGIYIESPLPHPSVVMRRTWLERVEAYQDHGWPEDYDLWLRMHLAGARFGKVPEVLLHWREGPQRLTRTDGRYSVENFLRAKAHYLCHGPLATREAVLIWGAGQMGRRLSKHLARGGAKLTAFIDIDPRKIGGQKRGLPVLPVEQLMEWWRRYQRPIVLTAVASRGARRLIRERLQRMGLEEGEDFLAVA